ncbi:DEKNAAC100738 [Brettanomyces naardenensis]|uniref:HECT-type E3 ubiquitin transferase n=1 Tax=Brettanomyces naardenensis TaxID=13370 RepID=A0A448YGA9_BRENA|nr:DEKNAAC100738 [Brettanomyces naardenensis]
MLILKRSYTEKEELTKPVKKLTEQLTSCSIPEMITLMQEKISEPWNGLRVDLFHYISVLNRIDAILQQHVEKYELSAEYPRLQEVSTDDDVLITTCLDYTYSLLEYSNNKGVYNSSEHIYSLILSASLDIRLLALKVTCLLCERFTASENSKCAVPAKTRNLLLKLARSFPPQVSSFETVQAVAESSGLPGDSGKSQTPRHSKARRYLRTSRQVSLLDCLNPESSTPQEWRTLDFEYYNLVPKFAGQKKFDSNDIDSATKREPDPLTKKNAHKNVKAKRTQFGSSQTAISVSQIESNQEGLHRFHLNSDAVARMSYQQIYERAATIIPKEKWFDFVTAVYVAKAYNNTSSEYLQLRENLVTLKCLAVAAASSCCFYSVLASTVFDEEPYLLSYMSDLVSPENKVPYNPSFAALRAFVNISGKKTGGSDLMRAWGGNVSHGLLFHLLRSILKAAKEDKIDMKKTYLNYVFNLVANFIDNKRLVNHLRSAGLLNIFLEFLTLRTNFRMTRSGPLHLIEIFIRSCPDVLDDLIANDGFNILINLLRYEVDFAIEDPDYDGGAPKDFDLSFTITVRQIKTINFLLKLVHDLITNHSGDRMRNLYDSPILQSLIKIMDNPSIFGYDLLTSTLRIIVGIINSEPTAYAILDESGVIDTFFNQFDSFLGRGGDLLLEIPGTISAIALNHGGHTKVLEQDLIPRFFGIFRSNPLCRELLKDDNCLAMGQEIDELARHHPGLKATVDDNVLRLLEDIPGLTHFAPTQFYQSPERSLYYSRTDKVVEKEEGCEELTTWETCKEGDMLECTAVLVSVLFDNSRIWKSLFEKVSVEDLMRFITVENAPFDYVLSNALYSVSSIIKAIDQEKPCFALKALNSELAKALTGLHSFIHFEDDDSSFFDQFDGSDPRMGGAVISKIGTVDCLLYVLSDVYGSPNKLSSDRILPFAEAFASEDGLDLVQEMLLFYRRIALEEVIFHSRTPSDAANNVVSVNQGITRYHVEIGRPNEKSASWDGTSAKFKNLSVLFFHFSRSQSWMRYIFASLCRISYDRRLDSKLGMCPKLSVAILLRYVNVTTDLLTKISTSNLEVECGYTLLLLNQLYSTMFMRPRTTDPINAAIVIGLLQNRGFVILRTLATKYFVLLESFPHDTVMKYADAKYVDINACSTTILLLSQILSIFAGVSTKSMISNIAAHERFYPDWSRETTPYYHELSYSVLVQTSLAAFGLLNELFHPDCSHILDNNPENIPIPLVEKLIIISKNFYTSVSTTQSHVFEGRLYPLSFRATTPSGDKLEYLSSLGMNEHDSSEVLIYYRNSLEVFYHDVADELYELFDDIEDVDWKQVCKKAKKNKFVGDPLEPVAPQYGHACTLDDLNFSRGANESNFIDYWIQMAQLFPKATFRISDLLLSVCLKSSYLFFTEVIHSVYSNICSFSFDLTTPENRKDAEKLSSMLQLLSYLVDDRSINRYPEIDENIITGLIDYLGVENSGSLWFPSALMVIEKFVAHSKMPEVPVADQIQVEHKFPQASVTFSDSWCLNSEQEEGLFEKLINIKAIGTCETACAVSRILILLCDTYSRCRVVYQSPILKALVGSIREFPDQSVNLQNLVINLFRRCMENKQTIEAYMDREIDKVIQPKKSSSQKPRVRDLSGVIKENSSLVMRDDSIFAESVDNKCILYQCSKPLKSMSIVAITAEQRKFVGGSETSMNDATDSVKEVPYNTGIMSLLLSELMLTSKKNLVSTPLDALEKAKAKKEEEEATNVRVFERDTQKNYYSKEDMFQNRDLAYALFILQCIAELLFSYKQAKTEFLMFSKRNSDPQAVGKPRSTALNILVHRLIFSDPFNRSSSVETKRRKLLSQFASVCIFALVSSVPLKNMKYDDPKIVDPDMTFVRKFTVDILIKALKGENVGNDTALVRYGKIVDILDVVCKLLGDSYELSLTSAIDLSVTHYDYYRIAKELLEKKFSFLLTSILADLDTNFPYTEDISGGIMRCLSALGEIKVQDQELFKEGQQPGEGDEELLNDEGIEDREEIPDLLRNSTLGMYDVDEIENEEEEDEDDLDEDILDDEDIEIVYSPNEDADDDEEMQSLDDNSAVGSDVDLVFEEDQVGEDDEEGNESDSDEGRYIQDDNFMVDVVSDSDEGVGYSDEDEDEEGDESDIIISDGDFDLIEGDDVGDIGPDDEDDAVDDGTDSMNNSDDDSAILDEWINEHGHDEFHRRGSRGFSDTPGFDEGPEDDGFNFNRLFMSRAPESEIEIVPPTEAFPRDTSGNPFSLIDISDNTFSRTYDANGPLMTFNFGNSLSMGNGTLADVLRALQGHGGGQAKRSQRVPNIFLKSTVQRWLEVAHLYYGKTMVKESCRVIPSIINNIYEKSLKISEEEERKKQDRLENIRKAREEEELKRREEEQKAKEQKAIQESNDDHEPIYINIGGTPVDISGTDIDPEFLEALPDDMREEVFTQHVRQRRVDASSSGERVREVDPEFMAALPEDIRSDIMRDEYQATLERRIMQNLGEPFEDEEEELEPVVSDSENIEEARPREIDRQKKKSKVFFPAMVDKFGVAAMLKMVFVPQLYYKRESFFKAISYLCYNRHTRSEVITIFLYILQEGLRDQASLELLYYHLCQRAKLAGPTGSGSNNSTKSPMKSGGHISDPSLGAKFPAGCTTLTVATQAIDVIQFLLENENHMRFHFLMEQESTSFMKKLAKRHNVTDSSYRYPINILLSLLDDKLIKEDSNLMDILSRSIQIATMPLKAMKDKLIELDESKGDIFNKKPQLPVVPDGNLRLVVDILVADECASKVFQQTIVSIQNLSTLDNAKVIFPHELSRKATALSSKIATGLRTLVKELNDDIGDFDELASLSEFSSASSDQAKLLRVLTALDYLFQKDDGDSSETEELKELYRNSALGPLWGALSDCLKLLTKRSDLSQVTTVLSPLIEALMVVCKHSKVERLPVRDVLRYEEEKIHDFANEPIESLFFSFTEEHKKILNQMIRNNPKLMSGPFSVLIRNPKVLEFDNKRVYFQQKLQKENEEKTELNVTIRRDQVFLDSYRAIFFKPPETVRKSNLEIHFRGEEGVDAGGLTREWYQVLSRQIFNPDYALFTPVTSDKTTFHPNRTSWVNPEHLSFFKFVGMIIGKAVYDGYMLDCHFTRAVFKRILGKPVSLKDMESLDPDYYKSLIWMLENDITDIIVETFSVEADDYGEHKIIDLKENGRNIPVTDENKQEYVRLIVEYRLLDSVKDQMDNFLEGFYQIIPKDLVAIFDEQELELLISGLPDIDVDDWKNNTSYVNYSASSSQIQWFWRAVKSFNKEERAKLLQFATGTSKVPLNGFKELSGVNGVSKFSIHRVYGDTDRLPSAHTCFNQIDLPEYENYEKLRAALLLAVREGHEGFGFV